MSPLKDAIKKRRMSKFPDDEPAPSPMMAQGDSQEGSGVESLLKSLTPEDKMALFELLKVEMESPQGGEIEVAESGDMEDSQGTLKTTQGEMAEVEAPDGSEAFLEEGEKVDMDRAPKSIHERVRMNLAKLKKGK